MRKTLSAGLIAGLAALIFAAGAMASSTLVVGNNPQTCPDAQYPTINAAVAAATAGDTIRVCPGVYPEHVVVSKSLTIVGARHGQGSDHGDGTQAPDPSQESIVQNAGQGGFDVVANDVVIEGFTVQGVGPVTTYPDAAITLETGVGRTITENVLRENGLGVYVADGQDKALVEGNAFLGNTRGANPQFIPSGGLFACCGGTITNSSFSRNFFTANAPGQFDVNVGTPSQGLLINRNEAVQESTLVVLGNSTNAQVNDNHGTQLDGSAILLFGNNTGTQVEQNRLEGKGAADGANGGSGIRTRLAFGASAANTQVVISRNKIDGFTLDGINLNDLTASTVSDNASSNNARNGLRLSSGVSGNDVNHNRARRNANDGLHVEMQASGNTLTSNRARRSGGFDCFDDTTGAGTAGTANFWLQDFGRTQNRPGLCRSSNGGGGGGGGGEE